MPNIFKQGDWAESFMKGMEMARMREQGEIQREQLQQQQAERKMRMEEFRLKVNDMLEKKKEADRIKQDWEKSITPQMNTVEDSSYGFDQGSASPYTQVQGNAPIDDNLGIKISPVLRALDQKMGGELLKGILLKRLAPDNNLTEWEVLQGAAQGNPLYQKIIDMKKGMSESKPVNMPPWYDSMLIEKYGSNANNPEIRKQFDDWVMTPEGQKAVSAYRQKYASETAIPYAPIIQTGTGFYKTNTRDPNGPVVEVKGSQGEKLGRPLPETATNELSQMKTTYDRLVEVESKIKSLGNKSGPLEGRWNKLKVKFANDGPTQEVVNELESMITIAYSLSGKQISVQELNMLKSAMLPRLEQPQENLLATINFAKNWLQRNHNNRLKYEKDSGYATNIPPLGNTVLLTPEEMKTFTESQIIQRAQLEGFPIEQAQQIAKDIISKRQTQPRPTGGIKVDPSKIKKGW